MKNITQAFEGLIVLGAIELVDYLNISFVEPIKELGFIPKKFADVYDEDEEDGLYVLKFELDGGGPPNPEDLNKIMAEGHDDGNNKPYWAFEYGDLYVIVPYSL